jgi:glucosylglycerate phosphorylase
MSCIVKFDKDRQIIEKLKFLFSAEEASIIHSELEKMIDKHSSLKSDVGVKKWVDEKDVFLITYGDSIKSKAQSSLKTLHGFLKKDLQDYINYVHILPFYPYSSDDGFSVIDYFKVDKELGDWNDVETMSDDFKLMFDGVINHISAKSDWFSEYLKGNPEYRNYFIETEDTPALSKVFRPRALPLLTKFDTANGEKWLWTTFSADQIDLNFKNKETFLKIIELLLFYVKMGAKAIRLDAIGFMWKELGTNCMHLPQTHKAIQLYRDIFKIVAPDTLIITETNVPHKENISYFGDGTNEAQMVYQFPLPPLVLYSMIKGNAKYLSKWASGLTLDSDQTTYFNFLASHDGIGVVPTHGILSDEQRQDMIDRVQENGGNVSYKTKADGSQIPYELNVNYFDAVSLQTASEVENIDRFICSQAILLSVVGVPAIYIHSLLGSRNYYEGVKETGRFRSINREKLSETLLSEELENTESLRSKILDRYKKLISIRKGEKAFHPNALQRVLHVDDRIFSIIRGDSDENIIVLNNTSSDTVAVDIDLLKNKLSSESYTDLISTSVYESKNDKLSFSIQSYQVVWLKA